MIRLRGARRTSLVVGAVALVLLLPVTAAAHPLGNFTINHYAGLRIAPDRISLDIVIDQAEIPTFQERQRIDASGDGQVSDAELAAERTAACPRLSESLALTVDGAARPLSTVAAGLSFPAGAGGLPTMRTVCEYESPIAPINGEVTVRFEDRSNVGRLGWREIVVQGDQTIVNTDLPATSVSGRLTAYPQDLLSLPLNVPAAEVRARPGGAALSPWTASDATPLSDLAPTGAGANGTTPTSGAPGGVAADIRGLLGTEDLTPLVVVLSFLAAAALGAGHALTPGHGKTIMAAYLVGTRGGGRHALGLGLATAVSHTLGVLALAGLIVLAGTAFPMDRVYPVLTAVSGLIVVAIGAWMLAAQVRRWTENRARRGTTLTPTAERLQAAGLQSALVLGRPGSAGTSTIGLAPASHAHHDDRGQVISHHHERSGDAVRDHLHDHAGDRDAQGEARRFGNVAPSEGVHRHGWRVHSHTPAQPSPLTWRALFALGLSGGLVPSTNALIILVATVAAGRPAYGVVLVVAFGLGMATVLVGVGLAMVYASGWMGRSSRGTRFGRLLEFAPVIGAIAVLLLGVYLTQQAIAGTPVL